MAIHLTVCPGLGALVEPLAQVLAVAPADFFAPELIAIPGEGVRSWLTWQLSQRLGGSDGIVANIEWVFPATIGRRALGLTARHDLWGVDALTWAVHGLLLNDDVPGFPHHDADLARSRAIADLFDRYGLRRPGMVAAWERGHDVDALGRPLAEAQRWQPLLWRALVQYNGAPSSATLALERLAHLRQNAPGPEVPERFVVAGVSGLAWFQLEVLAALSLHRHVHVLATVPSATLWRNVVDVVNRHHSLGNPIEFPRIDDPTAQITRHSLLQSWGRAAREAQCNVINVLGGQHHVVQTSTGAQPGAQRTMLDHLQAGLRHDEPVVAASVQVVDDSIRWHRCHGPARQAEVVRDALLHVFERRNNDGTPCYEPRDVVVLCTDIAIFAPLLEAAFAGAPEQGVPEIPIRIADRTLRGDTSLFDVVEGLTGLLERRWPRNDILNLARLPAVRRRFALSSGDLNHVAEWLEAASVRWGLTPADHYRAGMPLELRSNSMQSGLDQLFVGAALASGSTRGPDDVAPTADLESDDLTVLGAFADFVQVLELHVEALSRPAPVPQWIGRLRAAISDLARLPDADAWQWGALERELSVFAETARLADNHRTNTTGDTTVDPMQLAQLVVSRLGARPSHARFDTGAVTVSSLAGQRGVPRRVVVLLGLDEASLSAGVPAADDLVVAVPFVGDPDTRAEVRAQLLDAVLAAGDQLVLVSTGFDVRTNDAIAPAVALSELVDVINAVIVNAVDQPSWVVDHPRQPWNPLSLQPGALGQQGPWTFHRGVAALATRLDGPRHGQAVLAGELPREHGDRSLTEAIRGITRPVEALLRDRCAMVLPSVGVEDSTVLPLGLDSLSAWTVREHLLNTVLETGEHDHVHEVIGDRLDLIRRRGVLPPLALGDAMADDLVAKVRNLITLATSLGAAFHLPALALDTEALVPNTTGRSVVGRVSHVRGDQLLRISPSKFARSQELSAWVELAVLTVACPERAWHAVVVGSANIVAGAKGRVLTLTSVEAAREALAVIVDLGDRARCEVLPLNVSLSEALYRKGVDGFHTEWAKERPGSSERWIRWGVGDTDLDHLLEIPSWPDTHHAMWGTGGRLERWSHRLWSTFDATTNEVDPT